MSSKQVVLEAVQGMPEEISLEQIIEELEILAAIRRSEQIADKGNVVSHENVKSISGLWISK